MLEDGAPCGCSGGSWALRRSHFRDLIVSCPYSFDKRTRGKRLGNPLEFRKWEFLGSSNPCVKQKCYALFLSRYRKSSRGSWSLVHVGYRFGW